MPSENRQPLRLRFAKYPINQSFGLLSRAAGGWHDPCVVFPAEAKPASSSSGDNMKRIAIAAALASALCATAVTPAQAEESLTLKKIKDTGTITLGHRESSIPFSYYDDKQQV